MPAGSALHGDSPLCCLITYVLAVVCNTGVVTTSWVALSDLKVQEKIKLLESLIQGETQPVMLLALGSSQTHHSGCLCTILNLPSSCTPADKPPAMHNMHRGRSYLRCFELPCNDPLMDDLSAVGLVLSGCG